MSTRIEIVEILKRCGEMTSHALAEQLSLTPMAVKLQLYDLEKEGVVRSVTAESHSRGRPSKLWSLADKSDQFFPNAHAELSRDLLVRIRRTLGERALDQVIDSRAADQASRYEEALRPLSSLRAKLDRLASLRSEEGYMANVEIMDGCLMLIENHCPICTAARECVKLCSSELEVFQKVLAPEYTVERSEHIVQGARRCAYRVRKA
jgi:predicted ArsR family transcriptional regulator